MSEVWDLYRRQPSFVLGFHGCDRDVGEAVLNGDCILQPSTNDYDWLGTGVYFWENNPVRAVQFAKEAHLKPHLSKGYIEDPSMIGAVIDLGRCANLLETSALEEVKEAFELYRALQLASGTNLPSNKGGDDKARRFLDCAVIDMMHKIRRDGVAAGEDTLPYQTVKSLFQEGGALFDGSGFCAKSHIQIAVVDQDCIRGYVRPIPKD